jgi:hypothetical protein
VWAAHCLRSKPRTSRTARPRGTYTNEQSLARPRARSGSGLGASGLSPGCNRSPLRRVGALVSATSSSRIMRLVGTDRRSAGAGITSSPALVWQRRPSRGRSGVCGNLLATRALLRNQLGVAPRNSPFPLCPLQADLAPARHDVGAFSSPPCRCDRGGDAPSSGSLLMLPRGRAGRPRAGRVLTDTRPTGATRALCGSTPALFG